MDTLAIIVPAVVTPLVVAGFAFFQRSWERRKAEDDELRGVVDGAARALRDAYYSVFQWQWEWARGEARFPSATSERAVADIRTALFEQDRLVIRLAREHPVTTSYTGALTSLHEHFRFVQFGVTSGRPWRELERESRRKAIRCEELRSRFHDEARASVGHGVRFSSPLHSALPLPPGRLT